MSSQHPLLLTQPEQLRSLLSSARRIAVLGIKPESHSSTPAFYVPQYLQRAGFEIIPVPVYYPEVTHILGNPVIRKLEEISGHVDIVDIFRRSEDIPAHLDALLALKPTAVWMQSGISHPEVAMALANAGIQVVQNHCIMVEHRSLCAR